MKYSLNMADIYILVLISCGIGLLVLFLWLTLHRSKCRYYATCPLMPRMKAGNVYCNDDVEALGFCGQRRRQTLDS